jgi:hypothetical protein
MINSYSLSGDIYLICSHFADRVVSTNKDEYAKRKQTDIEKIKNDIIVGKLAEWGVYFIYLTRGRINISPPDMNVYNKNDKSFDPDLKFGMYNIHVKAQTKQSADRYGDSWILQSKDPLFEYTSEYDILIGCRVTFSYLDDSTFIEIKLEKPASNLVFGETKLSKFKDNKKAIYLKDNE